MWNQKIEANQALYGAYFQNPSTSLRQYSRIVNQLLAKWQSEGFVVYNPSTLQAVQKVTFTKVEEQIHITLHDYYDPEEEDWDDDYED